MTRTLGIALAALCTLAFACQRYEYRLDLRPVDGGLERTLNWSLAKGPTREPASLPMNEHQRVAGLYGAALPAEAVRKTVLASTFSGPMPDDIGGFGRFITLGGSLGTMHVYAERFRGSDDALARWERQSASIDAVVDLWALYLGDALRGEPGLEALQTAIDRRLRRDLKNASMMAGDHLPVLLEPDPLARTKEEAEEATRQRGYALAVRLLLYFMERGYFSTEDVPRILRIAHASGPESGREFAALVRRLVARWMERDAASESPALAKVFDDASPSFERFAEFVNESAEAREVLSRWAAAVEPENAQSKGTRALLDDAMGIAIFGGFEGILKDFDKLDATLATGTRPLMSSGLWNEADASVQWTASLPAGQRTDRGVPFLACAVWVAPDEPAQTRALGRVALRGEELAAFCLWRAGLLPDEGRQWDAFIGALTPDEGAAERLTAFRFAGRESDEEPPRGAAILRAAVQKK